MLLGLLLSAAQSECQTDALALASEIAAHPTIFASAELADRDLLSPRLRELYIADRACRAADDQQQCGPWLDPLTGAAEPMSTPATVKLARANRAGARFDVIFDDTRRAALILRPTAAGCWQLSDVEAATGQSLWATLNSAASRRRSEAEAQPAR